MFTIEFEHLDSLWQFYSERRRTSKVVNLKISAKIWLCDLLQSLKITETSLFCFIRQKKHF